MQARRAGRRSCRARRVPASAGSASRAELGKGEKWSLGKYALLGNEQRTRLSKKWLNDTFSIFYGFRLSHLLPGGETRKV